MLFRYLFLLCQLNSFSLESLGLAKNLYLYRLGGSNHWQSTSLCVLFSYHRLMKVYFLWKKSVVCRASSCQYLGIKVFSIIVKNTPPYGGVFGSEIP